MNIRGQSEVAIWMYMNMMRALWAVFMSI